ncbi:hypothetical protein NQT74_10670 [Alteromonas stellipolaris]|uniref:hypothetical protein n=1 Tax=Alteromonas stellipolaris TaxID=233316 RepID=UPI0021198A05|nr:hypothetical protein [Alteromonas stellipolaris]MCQ8849043.1 hypothetical protein [Alteromonas stellipolaris]
MKTKADYSREYFPVILENGSRFSALLRFIMTRLNRGDMRQVSVFSVCSKQSFTPSEVRKAFDLLESREVVTFSVHKANSGEFITVHLTSLGREIFKGLRDEA